jgi:hypothetical protein
MATTDTAPPSRRPARPGGPPPLAPALACGALIVVAVLLSARVPHPSASANSVLAYDQTHQTALRVAGCLGFAAAVPLAVWTATVYRRLRTLGVTAPGAVIGLCGGLLAASSVALSGLLTWTSSEVQSVADPALASALADLSYASGAAGFVAPLGLLIAGVAVPGLILGLLPRPLAWIGLAIAALSLLATFTLLTTSLDFTVPVGRFGGLAWLIIATVALPRDRRSMRRGRAMS